jgi:probable rRNA maturation factor
MSESLPDLEVGYSLEAGDWESTLSDPQTLVETAAHAAFAAAEMPDALAGALAAGRPAEMSLVLADDAKVQILNRGYRGKDRPTNVLSFALLDDADDTDDGLAAEPGMPILIGDVVLAYETVLREAGEQGKSFGDHVTHLVIHGVLHLLGYDHETDPDADRMERLETTILARLGIADPYADAASQGNGEDGVLTPQPT